MSLLLSELLAIAQLWLAAAVTVFLRIGAAALVLPGFGETFIPVRIRLAVALAFTFILTPALASTLPRYDGVLPPTSFFLSEAVIGLMLGIGLRLIVQALQVAGSMAAQATSLAQVAGGITPDPQPAISALLMLAGLTLAVAAGLHLHLIETFLRSYEVFPAGQLPLARDTGAWGVARVASVFSLAFSLAAPFLVVSMLYNLALGVISKAMPQLMVAFVGAPAITWAALFLLLLTAPFLLPLWYQALQSGLSNPFGAL